jgi:hypothetical protein
MLLKNLGLAHQILPESTRNADRRCTIGHLEECELAGYEKDREDNPVTSLSN